MLKLLTIFSGILIYSSKIYVVSRNSRPRLLFWQMQSSRGYMNSGAQQCYPCIDSMEKISKG